MNKREDQTRYKFRGGILKDGLDTTWPFAHLVINEQGLEIYNELLNKNYSINKDKIIKIEIKRWFPVLAEGLHVKYQGDIYSEDIYFWVMPTSFKKLKSELIKYDYLFNDLRVYDKSGNCKQCGHPFDPHLVITADKNNPIGGIIRCPVEGCGCHSTWELESKK